MIARSYPFADFVDLAAWCDLNTLLFLVDDMLDEQDIIKDKDSLNSFINSLFLVLEDRKECTVQADGPILAALADFWLRMVVRANPVWQKKFIQGMKDTFAVGGAWAFDCIINRRPPELSEYMELRQLLGAANLATDSLEVMARVELPAEIYEHPIVKRLTTLCRNAICIANDLFSFSKEVAQQADGAAFNLISILQRHHSISVDDAIQKTAGIHNDLVREFVALSTPALLFDNETNSRLFKYITALGCLMRGNIEWSTMETTRYPHLRTIERMGV